jgi:UDP-N-acetylglucosamine transferase subunit ALG13
LILVTLGTQKFQFNRLLTEIDNLIVDNMITDVFAQIGHSSYTPTYFEFCRFLDKADFNKKMDECEFVITHAGTGAITTALKKGKKVIVVPRLSKFGEHVDDHQLEIANEFEASRFVEAVYDVKEIREAVLKLKTSDYNRFKSNTANIMTIIDAFIEDCT